MSTLTISTIQTDLYWENKEANMRMLEDKIVSLKGTTEVVVLPEMFSTGFSMNPALFAEEMDGETVRWMKKMSIENRLILTGSIMVESEGKYFNRLIWMMPNGESGYYDKRHLFGYSDEDKYYSAGSKRLIVSVKGWRINAQVCYDLRFPVWARQSHSSIDDDKAGAEYDILLYVANWPDRRIHAWKTLLCARAIENQCYVIGVNRVGTDGNKLYYSGNSLVIDPLGEVLYHMADAEDIFTITLSKDKLDECRMKFPFLRDGDGFRVEG